MLTDINKQLGSRGADSARSGTPNQAGPYQGAWGEEGGHHSPRVTELGGPGYLGSCHCLDGNGDLGRQADGPHLDRKPHGGGELSSTPPHQASSAEHHIWLLRETMSPWRTDTMPVLTLCPGARCVMGT